MAYFNRQNEDERERALVAWACGSLKNLGAPFEYDKSENGWWVTIHQKDGTSNTFLATNGRELCDMVKDVQNARA